ncbi:MAG: hypothetical protein AAFQ53_02455 [Bacteroidota bacterium]
MKLLFVALLGAAMHGALASPQAIDIPRLHGKSPSVVAVALGAPFRTAPAPAGEVFALRDDVFEVSLGGTNGVLTVTYCDDQAYAFDLSLSTGEPSAEALLALTGINTSGMTQEEASPQGASWSGGGLERLQVTATDAGWVMLAAEYDSFGC